MMKIIIEMITGIILFFAGIIVISFKMKHEYINNFKGIVNKIIKNEFLAVVIGMIVSISINNSTLASVSAILLVNAQLISFRQAFGIMVGGTVALQLLNSLDLSIIRLACILLCVAALFYIIIKNKNKVINKKVVISLIAGYTITIIGIIISQYAIKKFIVDNSFLQIIGSLEDNSLINILIGLFLSGLCWNSYFIAGVMISFNATNLIDFYTSAQVLIGCSLGIIIPVILSGIICNKQAKKTSLYYVLFESAIAIINVMFAKKYCYSISSLVKDPAQKISFFNSILGVGNIVIILILFIIIRVFKIIVLKKFSKENRNNKV